MGNAAFFVSSTNILVGEFSCKTNIPLIVSGNRNNGHDAIDQSGIYPMLLIEIDLISFSTVPYGLFVALFFSKTGGGIQPLFRLCNNRIIGARLIFLY